MNTHINTENTEDIVLYSYSDDSSYVSSDTSKYTPFPSLTNIEKQKIIEICNNNADYANQQEINEIYKMEDENHEPVTNNSHSCCYIA